MSLDVFFFTCSDIFYIFVRLSNIILAEVDFDLGDTFAFFLKSSALSCILVGLSTIILAEVDVDVDLGDTFAFCIGF